MKKEVVLQVLTLHGINFVTFLIRILYILKSYMMPVSMGIGIIFYEQLSTLSSITPYLISVMLFISYCNISLKDIRVNNLHIILLLIQLLGCLAAYFLLYSFNPVVAQGIMICILAPTATSAIVITAMLDGNTVSLATYSLLSNMAVVIFAPLILVFIGYEAEFSFWISLLLIFKKVFLVLILPFVISLIFRKILPLAFDRLKKKQSVSFYIWNIALIIVTATTVKFITEQDNSNFYTEIIIAVLALLVCALQFFVGKRIGRKFNDTIAAGQGLGQKNTILAIWMAQMYLTPLSSIGPGTYILWQNMINSYQIWKKRKSRK